MNIRNKLKVLFVSIGSILMLGQGLAQQSDSALINMGYDVKVAADESSAAVGVATAEDLSKFFAINPANALF